MRSIGSRTALAAMAFGALSFAAAAVGCATTTPRSDATSGASVARRTPTVPEGVVFHATLDGPLSSEHSNVGDRITATLDEPLLSNDGLVLVQKGAKLNGHVLEVAREGVHRLAIQFDTIEVGGHARSVYARITRIESARVVASHGSEPSSVSVDVYPLLPHAMPSTEAGGGPAAEQLPLEINGGASIQLTLSRPLVLSGDETAAP